MANEGPLWVNWDKFYLQARLPRLLLPLLPQIRLRRLPPSRRTWTTGSASAAPTSAAQKTSKNSSSKKVN